MTNDPLQTRSDSGVSSWGQWLLLLIIGTLVITLVLFRPSAGSTDERVAWMTSYAAALELAQADDKPLLIRFTADWCPPCQAMKAEVFADADFAKQLQSRYVPVSIDMDHPDADARALIQRLDIQALPTLLVMTPEQAEDRRTVGYAGREPLERWLGLASAQ